MNGFLNIYKKKGMTSHDVVKIIRKKLGEKIGHLGTLDPMAEGVLPLALGSARRLIQFLPPQNKTYLAEIQLGICTDTLDLEGEIIVKEPPRFIDKSALIDVLKVFLGRIKQTPPKYSAVKISGRPAYSLARKNIDFKIPEREIEIYSIDLIDYNFPFFRIETEVSSGTYIRSLCEDIAKKLNQPAVLSGLQRQKCGSFRLEESINIDEINILPYEKIKERVIPIEAVFCFMPKLEIKEEFENKILNGVSLTIENFKKNNLKLKENEKISIYDEKGKLISIGEIITNKITTTIKPIKVFKRGGGCETGFVL